MNFLDFEQPIAELEAKIEELRFVENNQDISVSKEILALKKRSQDLTESIFSSLTPWQISQISRHPKRPYTKDYIERVFVDFEELHGERYFADDPAIITGIGRLANQSVAIIGHQKGRDTKERIMRNYGMPKPEGYRKALRIMRLAEKFNMPVLTFIDTPGAYPGIEAEERGQSEAIAKNLLVMAELKTPIIATIIGEGGSGGALAIGVADHLLMLQYSIYSVISPEGCASILWKSADKAKEAAQSMGIDATRLKDLGLIDHIIDEPLGGAHRDFDEIAKRVKIILIEKLEQLCSRPVSQIVNQRQEKLRRIGRFEQN
jgi:acetyl-CoA carboxylase carboxyl transferase subunit alpha